MSFDRETARIQNHNFSPLKDSVEEPWGINMTPKELEVLMKLIRTKSSAADQAPENAGRGEGEPAGNGGTKHPRDEDEDDEDPEAPSKPKTKIRRPASKRPRK